MARKSTYQKSDIIEAAFAVVRAGGYSALSAKTIAHQLGGSTMPIYSYLKSMGRLEKSLLERAYQTLAQYQEKRFTDDPFLDIAIGSVLFAQDEVHLYQFINNPKFMDHSLEMGQALFQKIVDRFPEHPWFQQHGANKEQMEAFGWMLWIFTHGLAHMVNVSGTARIDFLKDTQAIADYLKKVGQTLWEGFKVVQTDIQK